MAGERRPVVTIAVCTRNRAASLARTLVRVQACRREIALDSECIVIDNGSTDETPSVVDRVSDASLPVRWLLEARRGVARARNTALRAARGDVIAFVDDDAVPEKGWLAALISPILLGHADAVAGGIRLPTELVRPWMEPWHRAWLGDTLSSPPERPVEMYGANMAIGRHVLDRVPAFDPELGVGALGHGEEALFSYQVRVAGLRIVRCEDAVVVHEAGADHLTRRSFLDDAVTRGRSMAYIHYHWSHAEVPHVRKKAVAAVLAVAWSRVAHSVVRRSGEGLPRWEMELVRRLSYLRQFAKELRRPRNYEREGLVKVRGVMP